MRKDKGEIKTETVVIEEFRKWDSYALCKRYLIKAGDVATEDLDKFVTNVSIAESFILSELKEDQKKKKKKNKKSYFDFIEEAKEKLGITEDEILTSLQRKELALIRFQELNKFLSKKSPIEDEGRLG